MPSLLVNQIAAGEVVERPASVVKELVDNALDAGANAIAVEIEQGGIELIRVTDDGGGIPPGELPLALAAHATSKIRAAEDLERIGTMGFRGEALASIASVARVSIKSRTRVSGGGGEGAAIADSAGASVIEAEGDRVGAVGPASGPVGTSVAVRTLFFNTPARRKFLRTPATEQGRCVDVVRDAAMAHCAIAFRCVCDGRMVLDLPGCQSPKARLIAVLGNELAEQLIEVSGEDEGPPPALTASNGAMSGGAIALGGRGMGPMSIWGLVGLPTIARVTTQAQHVFLNGRPIRDRTIMHAIKEAYRGLIKPGRHATAALLIEMDPGAVDVNVHPTKTEVRFRDTSRVHSLVLRAVREALRQADLTPVMKTTDAFGSVGAVGILPGGGGGGGVGSVSAGQFAEQFKQFGQAGGNARLTYDALRAAVEGANGAGAGAAYTSAPTAFGPMMTPAVDEHGLPLPAPVRSVVQVHNSYLVTQDEQGMLVIDQHALHERVMFEKLLERLAKTAGGVLESQRLLTPVVVPASPNQVDALDALEPLLRRIGVEAAPMSPTTIGVQGFPTFLFDRGVEAGPFMTELLEKAEASGFVPGSEEALHEVLDMMACKAAVKAGDRMSDAELGELLAFRERIERSSNCPHGRPTSIRVTIKELEKRFGRV